MTKKRITIPAAVAAEVLFMSDRTCCVCRQQKKPTQIHHIDDDPGNNDPDNLGVLCFDCHTDTQISGGFHRKLDAAQVRLYRDDWVDTVQRRRTAISDPPPPTANEDATLGLKATATELEFYREEEDWIELARLHSRLGNDALRDEYAERAIAAGVRPQHYVMLRAHQERLDEVSDYEWSAAIADAEHDWTYKAYILRLKGDVDEAAKTYLRGILEALEDGSRFLGAFYIKHGLDEDLWSDLFRVELERRTVEGDLWWQMRCMQELGWTEEAKSLLLEHRGVIEAGDDEMLNRELATIRGDFDEVMRRYRSHAASYRAWLEKQAVASADDTSATAGEED